MKVYASYRHGGSIPTSSSSKRTPRRSLRERADAIKARIAIGAVVGRVVKLRRCGREFQGCCPFHNENTPSFTVVEDKGFAHCFGCRWHGDAIRFVMDQRGCSFHEALEVLEGDVGLDTDTVALRSRIAREAPANEFVEGKLAAATIWPLSVPARGTIVEAWLASRGIDPHATGILDVVRFHPNCPTSLWRVGMDHRAVRRTAPAMIAPILVVTGERGSRRLHLRGIHITYLAPDGRSKARLPSRKGGNDTDHVPVARRIWGSASRGAVLIPPSPLQPGCDVLTELARVIDAPGILALGEGLESSLSFAKRQDNVRLICAALSLGNLEGLQEPALVDDRYVLPIWDIKGSAHGHPFTIQDAGDVAIGVDNDMKATAPLWLQEHSEGPAVKRPLSPLERTAHCAALAIWQWRQAGAKKVDAHIPPEGCDFNDLDQHIQSD